MNAEYVRQISVIDPIDPAITKVKEILFSPFHLGRWFVIGFCAWLVTLGKGGGVHFNFPGNFSYSRQYGHEVAQEFKIFVHEHIATIVVGAIAAFALFIALIVLFLWLSSRGRFMFLYCVARNKAEVKKPWTLFRRHANSLFVFRLVIGLIGLFVFAGLAAIMGVMFLVAAKGGPGGVLLMVIGFSSAVLVFLPVTIVFGLIAKFTKDFVVPIM